MYSTHVKDLLTVLQNKLALSVTLVEKVNIAVYILFSCVHFIGAC